MTSRPEDLANQKFATCARCHKIQAIFREIIWKSLLYLWGFKSKNTNKWCPKFDIYYNLSYATQGKGIRNQKTEKANIEIFDFIKNERQNALKRRRFKVLSFELFQAQRRMTKYPIISINESFSCDIDKSPFYCCWGVKSGFPKHENEPWKYQAC